MKSFLSLCLVLALVVVVIAGYVEVDLRSCRSNLLIGYIDSGDTLLYGQYAYHPHRHNTIQSDDISIVGHKYTRVSALRATEVGPTQHASVWVIGGGIGYNNVTLRIQSSRGYDYYYRVEVYGSSKEGIFI